MSNVCSQHQLNKNNNAQQEKYTLITHEPKFRFPFSAVKVVHIKNKSKYQHSIAGVFFFVIATLVHLLGCLWLILMGRPYYQGPLDPSLRKQLNGLLGPCLSSMIFLRVGDSAISDSEVRQ